MILAFRRNPGLFALWLVALTLLGSLAVLTPRVLADPGAGGGAVAPQTFGQASLAAPAAVFRVLHDDHIGALALPAGNYTVTPFGGMTTTQAEQRFTRFLDDYDGRLPAPWTLDASTATFSAGSAGFAIAPAPAGAPATTTATGTVCPGDFVVEHDDRIGRLAFPHGDYQVTSLRGGCTSNMNAFRRLLARTDNRLPSAWTLAPGTGTFSTAAGPSLSPEATLNPAAPDRAADTVSTAHAIARLARTGVGGAPGTVPAMRIYVRSRTGPPAASPTRSGEPAFYVGAPRDSVVAY